MTRLIVEEGGARRGFKVGDGLLTVGSSEGAKLRLQAEGVADIHVELGIEDGRVMLRPRPGVVAPKIKGVPVKGPVELKHQVPVQIGSARLLVEYPDAAPAPAARKPGAQRRPSRDGGESPSGRGRYQPRKKTGPWVPLAIFAGVVAALALFVVVMGPRLLGEAPGIFEPAIHINRARELIDSADYDEALAELGRIPVDEVQISPAVQGQIDDLREQIRVGQERRALTVHNMKGNPYLQTQLKNFERNYLQGKADRPKVRVFVKRLDFFAQEWPQHPELDWVKRMRERYAAVVDLSAPADYEDIAFEIETLTWSDPRDFKQAFRVLDEFIAGASADDRAKALELYDEKLEQRDEWFEDKLQQARWEFERDELGKSLAWLIRIVLYTGDEVMAETAAQEIVRFPDLVERLRGYRYQSPEKFERLMAHPTVAAFVRENPLDG